MSSHRSVMYGRWPSIVHCGLAVSLALALTMALCTPARVDAGWAGTTDRASISDTEAEGNDRSQDPAISSDGRFVAFTSYATNLVSSDSNNEADVFIRDTLSGTTEIVSVADDESASNGYSGGPSISSDGRYVAFYSEATNLVTGDTNLRRDIFVRDRQAGTTTRVSVRTDGGQASNTSTYPSISADGRYVAFASSASDLVTGDVNGYRDVFVHDRQTGTTLLISRGPGGVIGNNESNWPTISGDGQWVVYQSTATNLVSGDTNAKSDVFIRSLVTLATDRVSLSDSEAQVLGDSLAASVSSDGRFVAFSSEATSLVAADNNGHSDVFIRDRTLGVTERVNVSSDEQQVSVSSWTEDYLRPTVSADGRYVAFRSDAPNLVAADVNGMSDVFVRDRQAGTTSMVSVSTGGRQGNDNCWGQSLISANGRFVAFDTDSHTLLNDSNGYTDVYVHDMVGDSVPSVSVSGDDRYQTAIDVSKKAFPDGLEPSSTRSVIIATGRNWPDALGGVALAGVLDGPVLLVDTHSISQAVLDEMSRLGANNAIILGGDSAVGPEVEAVLIDRLSEYNVERIEGADRYVTADKIAQRVIFEKGYYDGVAFVATGGNYPDALAAAPLAAANGWPLFLSSPTQGLSPGTKTAMAAVTHAVLLGGTGAVPASVETYLDDELGAGAVERLSGADRYATAVDVASYGVTDAGLGWNRVGLTTGEKFPDALAGGVLQGRAGSVMLLTKSATLSPAAQDALTTNSAAITTITFYGGPSALSQTVRDAASAAVE